MLGFNRSEHRTSGIGAPEATDGDRRLNNLFRVGVLQEVDYVKAVARVALQGGETLTDWLPWLTLRAGSDALWWAPEPGEVVFVASLSGELHNGFILGAAYSNGNRPAAAGTVARATFADGTTVEYDREAHHLQIDVKAGDPQAPTETPATESDAADGPAHNPGPVTAGRLTVRTAGNVEVFAQGSVTITGAAGVHINPNT